MDGVQRRQQKEFTMARRALGWIRGPLFRGCILAIWLTTCRGGSSVARGGAPATATPVWFAAGIDTMKESMDTDAIQAQLSDARIADTVNTVARLHTNYITVDT